MEVSFGDITLFLANMKAVATLTLYALPEVIEHGMGIYENLVDRVGDVLCPYNRLTMCHFASLSSGWKRILHSVYRLEGNWMVTLLPTAS